MSAQVELFSYDSPEPDVAVAPRPAWERAYVSKLLLSDLLCALAAAFVAYFVRFGGAAANLAGPGEVPYLSLAAGFGPLWLAAMAAGGAYARRILGTGSEEYRRLLNVTVRLLAAVAILSYATQLRLARGFVAIALPLALVLTAVCRHVIRKRLHARRAAGEAMEDVLVVGTVAEVKELVRHFRRSPHAGFRVMGAAVPPPALVVEVDGEPVPVLCNPSTVLAGLENTQADAVAIASTSAFEDGALQRLAWELEGTGIDLVVAPAVTDVAGPRISVRPVAGLPLLHVEEPQLSGVARIAKSIIDRTLALFMLVGLAPVFAVIALAVRLTTHGPVFFRQERVGRHGEHFRIWKFRSMRTDAERLRSELSQRNETDGVLFKIRNDPRITPIGRFLRRWSLDELPQLFNVLIGQMSIVGPRPPLPSEVENFEEGARRKLLVKPGLTGLWQVSGRAELAWTETVRLDLYYVENWSPALDIMIAWKTISAVLTGRGAY